MSMWKWQEVQAVPWTGIKRRLTTQLTFTWKMASVYSRKNSSLKKNHAVEADVGIALMIHLTSKTR